MSWADIENTTQAAIARAAGYAADRVVWSYQNVNEPNLDHVVITFGGELVVGTDWIQITQDLTRPNGQEIKQEIRGLREVPLEIEVFTSTTNGDLAARRVAELIRTRLRLPDINESMNKAGITPFDSGPVNYMPYIAAARFRGRAAVTVRCYVPVMDCIEYVGYIASVQGTVIPHTWVGVPSGATGFSFTGILG